MDSSWIKNRACFIDGLSHGSENFPQRLKPHSKQGSYRSAKALRHPKSQAAFSFSAASDAVPFPQPIYETYSGSKERLNTSVVEQRFRIRRLGAFVLIALVSLVGFAGWAGAQDPIPNQVGRSPELRAKAGKTHKAKVAAAASSYKYEVLHSFCSEGGFPNCADGNGPLAGLIKDTEGNLYGTTFYGGANSNSGTVFKVDNNGIETVLYNFCSTIADELYGWMESRGWFDPGHCRQSLRHNILWRRER